ncbi:hypothetical protein EGC78_16470 [Shewanella frigidimarina]|nr:hypothetical protein EGC78_16470 [Shewanella frigidimarina]
MPLNQLSPHFPFIVPYASVKRTAKAFKCEIEDILAFASNQSITLCINMNSQPETIISEDDLELMEYALEFQEGEEGFESFSTVKQAYEPQSYVRRKAASDFWAIPSQDVFKFSGDTESWQIDAIAPDFENSIIIGLVKPISVNTDSIFIQLSDLKHIANFINKQHESNQQVDIKKFITPLNDDSHTIIETSSHIAAEGVSIPTEKSADKVSASLGVDERINNPIAANTVDEKFTKTKTSGSKRFSHKSTQVVWSLIKLHPDLKDIKEATTVHNVISTLLANNALPQLNITAKTMREWFPRGTL